MASMISYEEESAVNLIESPWLVTNCFSLVAFKVFSLCLASVSEAVMCQCGSFWVYPG